MSDLTQAVQEMTDAISEQSAAIFHLQKDVDKQNERLEQFVPKGRFRAAIGSLALSGLLVFGFAIWAREERQADIARQQVASAARAFANCLSTNRAFDGVDLGYIALAQQTVTAAGKDEERVARTLESLRRLRSGLFRTDCNGHLVTLTPEDAERVRAESSRTLPTVPLPPTPFE